MTRTLSALLLLAVAACGDSGPAAPAVGTPPIAPPPSPVVPALPSALPPPAPVPIPAMPGAPGFITCRTDTDCPRLACGPCAPGALIPGGPQSECYRNPCPGAVGACEPQTGRCVVRLP